MNFPSMTVAHALLRAVLALVPTPMREFLNRSHECERSTHECVRYICLFQPY